MPVSVKQLRDNQNNFIYPKIAKEGLVEPINSNDVGISAINGIQSSTVQGALNELAEVAETYAEKGFTWTGTLKESGWSGSAAPYTQTITISGMQATDNPFLGPNYTSTDVDTVKGQEEAFSLIGRIDSGAGNITVYIYEDSKPKVDIPILVKVVH